jgi:hypothetical protein
MEKCVQPRKIKHDGKTWFVTHNGYYRFKGRYLHRHVWETANGPLPPELCLTHVDGDRGNNDLQNLATKPRTEKAILRRAAARPLTYEDIADLL